MKCAQAAIRQPKSHTRSLISHHVCHHSKRRHRLLLIDRSRSQIQRSDRLPRHLEVVINFPTHQLTLSAGSVRYMLSKRSIQKIAHAPAARGEPGLAEASHRQASIIFANFWFLPQAATFPSSLSQSYQLPAAEPMNIADSACGGVFASCHHSITQAQS
jgi:hypothetical protein